jgi:hypothetical protein
MRLWANQWAYHESLAIAVLLFPKAMYYMDFDHMPCVIIKSIHKEGDVMKVVEFPAF